MFKILKAAKECFHMNGNSFVHLKIFFGRIKVFNTIVILKCVSKYHKKELMSSSFSGMNLAPNSTVCYI